MLRLHIKYTKICTIWKYPAVWYIHVQLILCGVNVEIFFLHVKTAYAEVRNVYHVCTVRMSYENLHRWRYPAMCTVLYMYTARIGLFLSD